MLWKFSQQVRAVVTYTKCSLLPNQERKWNTTRAGVRTRAYATLLNVSTFKLNTLAGEALPFQLYYTVNESVPVPFFFLPPNTFPSGYWVTSHCHSSLLLDLKMFEDGLVRKWCQKYSVQAPDSLHKWGYYYYTTVIYLQPNRNIPRRGGCVLLVFLWTQKASHYVSNDLICMHCPLQICVTVGLPHPPKQVCCASNYHLLI